ncbi:hypothetical protein B8V09_03490 [Streptococcus agalactiae]|nr:hypothetical protein B8V09_03490 [Streptococcus agalactiae]
MNNNTKIFDRGLTYVSTGTKLHPFFVTGFTDAEGSFMIIIDKSNRTKLGYQVRGRYSINLHKIDLQLLCQIKDYFGVGSIVEYKESVSYVVTNLKELIDVIIPHFDKYPLITQKRADYELFKKAITLLKNKEHLIDEGFLKIINLKFYMNKGLSDTLKAAFPNTDPVPRPLVEDQNIKDSN